MTPLIPYSLHAPLSRNLPPNARRAYDYQIEQAWRAAAIAGMIAGHVGAEGKLWQDWAEKTEMARLAAEVILQGSQS